MLLFGLLEEFNSELMYSSKNLKLRTTGTIKLRSITIVQIIE
jgi:hypothetical protein